MTEVSEEVLSSPSLALPVVVFINSGPFFLATMVDVDQSVIYVQIRSMQTITGPQPISASIGVFH